MKKLTFKNLTLDNWPEFEDSMLNSELVFPESMVWGPEEFVDILSLEGSIGRVALLDSEYIGNSMATRLRSKVMYLYNIVIDPPYQGRGYGYRLLLEMANAVRGKGMKCLVGHFREGASSHIIKKIGGRKIYMEKDWCDSGENYIYFSLKLD